MNAITSYFQGVAAELRKVTWPTFPTVARHFVSVVVGVAFATALVGVFDFLFLKLLGIVLTK
jgi:preprotein translocase SecE subunit